MDVGEVFGIGIVLSREFQHDPWGMVLVWPAIFVVILMVALALVFRSRKQRRELRSLGIRKEGIVAETYMGKTVKFSWSDIERVDFHRGKGARVELVVEGKYFRLSSVFPGFAEVREALSEACRENFVETKVIEHGGKEKKPWFVGAPKKLLEKRAAEKREETRDGRLKYISFTRAVRKARRGEDAGRELKPVPESLWDAVRENPVNMGPVMLGMFLTSIPIVGIILGMVRWPQSVFFAALVVGGFLLLGWVVTTSRKNFVRAVGIDQQGFTTETFGGEVRHISWKSVSRVDILHPQVNAGGGIIVTAGDRKIDIGSYFPKYGTMVEMVLQECAKRRIMFYYSKWHLPGYDATPD